MKSFFLIISFFCSILILNAQQSWQGKSVDFSHGDLKVSENHRYLVHADGTPFLYLGDTAWELLHRLSKDDTKLYLENRRSKGFTVIQTVILAEPNGLTAPNAEGETPLIDNDPTKPNEAYFKHVDWVLQNAAEKGLYVGLLPTWGDKVDKQWGNGPEIFTKKNAKKYGRWLGKRYASFPNVIWIIGGDRKGGEDNFAIWNAMAEGIKSKDKHHLLTYHPSGESSSSEWFHHCNWLDFNTYQSGHAKEDYAIVEKMLGHDYNLKPVKPVMDSEPRYENIPKNFKKENGVFSAADSREIMYQSLLGGACGHTYGCNEIWQMYSPGFSPVIDAFVPWKEALDFNGAQAVLFARELFESIDFTTIQPAPSLLLSGNSDYKDMAVAAIGKGFAMVYLPNGNRVSINLEKAFQTESVKMCWFNPRNGEYSNPWNEKVIGNFEVQPPVSGEGTDWLLLIKKK